MKLVVVRVRGDVRITNQVSDTLKMLGLQKKNHCTVQEDTPRLRGMLHKAKPYITWGQADEKTINAIQKKGSRLNPPKKGYGRKGVKLPFQLGGAYGERKEKINDLIMRMI
jgi:large subunit ribosomal protein L30